MKSSLESNYLSNAEGVITRENFFVISGCSGGGKSTLLAALAKQHYGVVSEPGRQIVKEQQAIGGDALPWVNLDKFLELALSRCLLNFNSIGEKRSPVFFDRSIIDTVQVNSRQPGYCCESSREINFGFASRLLWPIFESLHPILFYSNRQVAFPLLQNVACAPTRSLPSWGIPF